MGLPAALAMVSVLLLGAAPGKKKAPSPLVQPPAPAPALVEPCTSLEMCLGAVEERFSATDFETAAVVARRAEGFAKTDAERARVVLLQATLLFHSAGALTPETEGIIVSRFELARKLDPALTALAIPPYARSQKLEALWDRARPPPPPKAVIIAEPPPAPPASVAMTEAPGKRPVLPILVGALGVAAGATGGVLFWYSGDLQRRVTPMMIDPANVDTWNQAKTVSSIAVVMVSLAGAALLTALVTWLVL